MRLRLNGSEPARAPPLKNRLKRDTVPLRTRQSKYPPEKCQLMSSYDENLISLSFIERTETLEWVSVPFSVTKNPQANFY